MARGILVPLDVPWMVSPSVSGMNVCTWEICDTEVGVNVLIPEGVESRGDVFCPEDPRVVITFKDGQWVSFRPGASDGSSIDYDAYDQSRLPLFGVPIDDYLEQLDAVWIRTQRCPDPGVYEVESSELLERTGLARIGFRHFIVGGHDVRVEVLATDFSWRYVPRTGSLVEAQ